MKINVGKLDRGIRLILGALVVTGALSGSVSFLEAPGFKYGAVAVGLILLITAFARFCPLYRILGIKTCQA